MKSNSGKLGNQLRELRISLGFSISDFSSKVGVTKGYLSRIECGKDIPSSEMIEKLARALKTDSEPLHILAGTLPQDVKRILHERPTESYSFLRENFSAYKTGNGQTLLPAIEAQSETTTPNTRQMDDSYQIYNIDCFEWMKKQPENSVHAIVTDPPYGLKEYSSEEKNKLRNGRGGVWRIPPSFDGCKRSPLPRFTILTDDERADLKCFFKNWASSAFRILAPGGHVFIATNPLVSHLVFIPLMEAGFEKRGEIIRLVQTLRGGDRPKNAHEAFHDVTVMPRSCWEPWGLFRKPCEGRVQDNLRKWKTGGLRRISEDLPFCDVIKSSPTRSIEREVAPHPSLKPQAFMRQIVRAALPLGEGVILDPFMGAGSTIAASNALGYRSIGIEMDSEFFKIAKKAIPLLSRISLSNGEYGKTPHFSLQQSLLNF